MNYDNRLNKNAVNSDEFNSAGNYFSGIFKSIRQITHFPIKKIRILNPYLTIFEIKQMLYIVYYLSKTEII